MIRLMAGTENARNIMADDHYGWFEKVDRGIYQLSPNGEKALNEFADAIAALSEPRG